MIKPGMPENEQKRLEALMEYQILDTLPEEEYDNITKIASEICGAPISLITLIDDHRQWFKSKQGLEVNETPREVAFCSHGILNPKEALIVENALEDERFKNNPLATGAPHVEFYAGIPLVNDQGFPLGSLCVIDNQPRSISEEQISSLKALADQVVKLMELRKTVRQLSLMKTQLEQSNKHLEEFAHIISHDIKAPLRNIKQLSEVFAEDYADKLDATGNRCVSLLNDAATESIDFIEGVLKYSKAIHYIQDDVEDIRLNDFMDSIILSLDVPEHMSFKIDQGLPTIRICKIALKQILTNLISNALKYNDKVDGLISINFKEEVDGYYFKVTDNGQGIPREKLDNIFTLFYMGDKQDAKRKGSAGIGLSIVEKLVTNLNGKIQVQSEVGKGTVFEFSLKK